MPSTNKIALSLGEMKELLIAARRNGTEGFWIVCALQWMEGAADEVFALREELKAADDFILGPSRRRK